MQASLKRAAKEELEKKKRRREFLLDWLGVLSSRARTEGYLQVQEEVLEVLEKLDEVTREIRELEEDLEKGAPGLGLREFQEHLQGKYNIVFTRGVGEEARREVEEKIRKKKQRIESIEEGILLATDLPTRNVLSRILAKEKEELSVLENAMNAFKRRRGLLIPELEERIRNLEKELEVARKEREKLVNEYKRTGREELADLFTKLRGVEQSIQHRINLLKEELAREKEKQG